jgi:hypothetical protein
MRRKSATIASWCLGVIILVLHHTGSGFSYPYSTENVVIVFMGGVRNTEAFDDSTHRYIPNIWANIRPQGVYYRDFYNMARTGMGTGTWSAMLGVRRDENQRGAPWRGLSPTMFEYYRKDRSVPQTKVWAVLSNDFDSFGINHSLHPGYGAPYAASLWGNSRNRDTGTFEEAMRVMDRDRPSLLTIHFRDPDRQAQHTQEPDLPDSVVWENYTRAIMAVDSLTNLLWEKIQTDSAYAGKTTLFITGEHGRHIPPHGDFQWHGDACEGCRRLPFLATGPDFKANETIELRGDLIDICPTVGELLSFDPVFAEGRVLREMFTDPQRGRKPRQGYTESPAPSLHQSGGIILSRQGMHANLPSIDVEGDVIHVTLTERDTSQVLEAWDVLVVKSTDAGLSWSEPAALFCSSDPQRETITAASLAGDSSAVAVMAAMYAWDEYWEGDSAWTWRGDLKISAEGRDWQLSHNNNLKSRRLSTLDNQPAISLRGSWCASALLGEKSKRYFAISFDLGENWHHFIEEYEPDEFSSPNTPSLLLDGSICYVETMRFVEGSRLCFLGSNAGDEPGTLTSIVDDTPGESFFPQLASGDSVLYCVWSDDRVGHWEVYFSRSTDSGVSWSPNVQLSESGVNTWKTALEVAGDTLLAVWEDYREGESSLYKKVSFDGGLHWSQDYAEVTDAGFSTSPKLSHSGSRYYMVWQDYRSGSWEIYFKEVDINLPVSVEGEDPFGDGRVPKVMGLSQNFPNPFNPSTTISFEVPGRGGEGVNISLRVHDLRGRLVRTLANGKVVPGRYRVNWDGTDGEGNPVSSGAYLYSLERERHTVIRKMLLIR